MKSIVFGTKEENNARREREFLALTPNQRVMQFIKMVSNINRFETSASEEAKGNFIIENRTGGIR